MKHYTDLLCPVGGKRRVTNCELACVQQACGQLKHSDASVFTCQK